jgi:hypothetical protein
MTAQRVKEGTELCRVPRSACLGQVCFNSVSCMLYAEVFFFNSALAFSGMLIYIVVRPMCRICRRSRRMKIRNCTWP